MTNLIVGSIVSHLTSEATALESAGNVDGAARLREAIMIIREVYGMGEGSSSLYPSLQTLFPGASAAAAAAHAPPDAKEREEQGLKLKEEGNTLLKQGDFQGAVDKYTLALATGEDPVFYANRAAAYMQLSNLDKASADCKSAIALNPDYTKAYLRLASCYEKQGQNSAAREAYEEVMKREPGNSKAVEGFTKLKGVPDTAASVAQAPAAAAPGGLDLGSLLSNPALASMATQLMGNPAVRNMVGNLTAQGVQGGAQAPEQRDTFTSDMSSTSATASSTSTSTSTATAAGSQGAPDLSGLAGLMSNPAVQGMLGNLMGGAQASQQGAPASSSESSATQQGPDLSAMLGGFLTQMQGAGAPSGAVPQPSERVSGTEEPQQQQAAAPNIGALLSGLMQPPQGEQATDTQQQNAPDIGAMLGGLLGGLGGAQGAQGQGAEGQAENPFASLFGAQSPSQ